jgi:uncharacterized membrane protein
MRIQVSLKTKTISALLLSVAIMDAFSLLLFTRIDTIVHGDLYNYGLRFDLAWAGQYWTYSHLFVGSLLVAIILVGISIGSFSFYVRRHSNASRVGCYVLLTVGTALSLFSVYLFYSIDYIVHTDLYSYGLQFSYNWAEKYWTCARLMLALIGFGSLTTIASITLISLGARKLVRIDPARMTSSILITTGAVAIFISVIYSWPILAFIGLGLLFWGITFTYVRTEEYARKILLDTTASSQQATLNQIIKELRYEGDVIYLPPKYFSDPETNKAFIPEQKNSPLPKPEQIQRQEQDFVIEEPPGVLFTPPGAELSKLFERTLETRFENVDLGYLQQNLPKLFVEDLEISQNLEMETEANKIRVQIENSVYKAPNTETEQPATIYSRLGSPLSSAIACAVAKATGKPIIMEKEQNSNHGRNVTIEYRILDEEAQAE